MSTRISYRWANVDDADALCILINGAYRGVYSKRGWTTEAHLLDGQRTDRASLRRLLRHPKTRVLVAAQDAHIIGCVSIEIRRGYNYLGMLTVRPDLQGQGLGKKLLRRSERWVREKKLRTRLQMTVIAQRPELLSWYERHGYRATGKIKPFPYGDERFGIPRRPDLKFLVLEKVLR